MDKRQVIVVYDTETTGPAAGPGTGSMINIGWAAIDIKDGSIVEMFEVNIKELADAEYTLAKHEWWQKPEQRAALDYITKNAKDPAVASQELHDSLKKLKSTHEIVASLAWPCAFDWQFLNYYLIRYVKSNPLGYSSKDASSFGWGKSGSLIPPKVDPKPVDPARLPERVRSMPHHTGLRDVCEEALNFYDLSSV